ncbi:TPA: hypothetical protein ACHWKF_002365 [Providencia stuartii]|uniref:hypothetical protein n=1 Tax=Providencia stuartii TaxID=588 RepID=UPI00090064CE|nr:hypothetical protein [Providencia stuartii]
MRWGQINLPFLSGVTLATLIAFVSERREGNIARQSFAEAVLCGALWLAFSVPKVKSDVHSPLIKTLQIRDF